MLSALEDAIDELERAHNRLGKQLDAAPRAAMDVWRQVTQEAVDEAVSHADLDAYDGWVIMTPSRRFMVYLPSLQQKPEEMSLTDAMGLMGFETMRELLIEEFGELQWLLSQEGHRWANGWVNQSPTSRVSSKRRGKRQPSQQRRGAEITL